MIKHGQITPQTPDVEQRLPSQKQARQLTPEKTVARLDKDIMRRLSDRIANR